MSFSADLPSFQKPASPFFSSGPTKKFPGWDSAQLAHALFSRSHRSKEGLEQLQRLIHLTKEVLEIPTDYHVGIVAGSATGAMETVLWSFLGHRGIDVFAWDVFGKLWVVDVVEHLKITPQRIFEAPFGDLPSFDQYNPSHDAVFTWNGTTAGVCIPQGGEWIPDKRQGLTICDATSAAFAVPLPWQKLDVTAFSWQKGLGSEAAHGMIVLSPTALQHLEKYAPRWPMPRLFRLAPHQHILQGVYQGQTINTPSMLCVYDCIMALEWAKKLGGMPALFHRTQKNFNVLDQWIKNHPFLEYLAKKPEFTSPTSVCFTLKESLFSSHQVSEIIQEVCQQLDSLEVAKDIKNHKFAPPSFRVWCGPTVEADDLELLVHWMDWALSKHLCKAK